jgi:N4-gp56 family major capsid protein
MATSVYPATGGFVDNTSAATFIPELWSDEVRAAYEKNLVMAPLVKKLSMKGKKGDTINIPAPIRGVATAKAINTAVTVQQETEGNVAVVIDKHFEYSRMIEDLTEVQALASLRRFYTSDAGYALARQIDTDLLNLGKTLANGTTTWIHNASFYNDASTGLTAYAEDTVVPADVFTDAAFRALIQKQDDADTPMDNRCFVIPPSLRNAIMGIDRYVSTDFVSGKTVNNGLIGNLYGIDVYVTSNCPVVETAANNSVNTNDLKAAMLFHKDTFILAEQLGIRSQTQYKQEFLGNLYTADTLYGVKTYRPDSGFVLVVNG